LVEQVAVIEHAGVMDSIKRAHQLSAKRFWILFGITSLSYSAIVLIAIGIHLPLGLFPEIDHWLLSAALSLPIDILMQIPISLLVAAYFDFLHDSRTIDPPSMEAVALPDTSTPPS
jgi:fumarate reductase subunit D